MWVAYIALFLGAVCLQDIKAHSDKPIYDLNQAPKYFAKFIVDYDRHYKDGHDFYIHYEAFVQSLEIINKVNSDPDSTFTADINKFADYTKEEMKKWT